MKTIAEADLQPATTPGDGWYIIEAAGAHARRVKDTELVQQLTPDALAAVAAAGVPAEGLPIDRDHLSLDAENSSEAMGWVRELAMCGSDLAARIEWTSLGLPLITGRVYKHFSTVYPPPTAEQLASGTYVPRKLIGLALTNQPNNKTGQPPITNRELPTPTTTTETTPTMFSPEILAALGLPEGATEAEVLAKVQELKQNAEIANTAVKAAEAAEAEAVINAAEKENGVELSPEEKTEAKEQIITNRAHGLKYVGLLCRDKRPVTNRAESAEPVANTRRYAGKTPLTNRSTPADPEQAIANRAQQLCDEARAAGKHLGYFTAVEKARAEHAKGC